MAKKVSREATRKFALRQQQVFTRGCHVTETADTLDSDYPARIRRWGYAQCDYDPASATFTPDKAGTPSCGQVCHVAVKTKDSTFYGCSRCSVMFLNAEQFSAFGDAAPNVEMPTVISLPASRR